MKKTIIDKSVPVQLSERFRIPSMLEKDLGLWVDRIGSRKEDCYCIPVEMRILNLYAAVAVTRGDGMFESVTTGQIEVSEGDVVLLFPEVPARYGSDSGWSTEWLVWQGREADAMIRTGCFDPEKPVIRNGAGHVRETLAVLKSLMTAEGVEAACARKLAIQQMLLALYRAANRKENSHRELIDRAVKYISGRLGGNLAVSEVAAVCNLSEVHFRRIFKAATGFSPKDYILRMKIAEAKRLSGSMPVKEIADHLGFCDEFHLRNAFRKITGITFGQFL